MSDELGPLDREAWGPLLAFLAEVEAEGPADAVEGLDADVNWDGWLAAMWAGVESAHVAAPGRALPPRPVAPGPRRGEP